LWEEKLRQEALEQCGLSVLRWTHDEITRRPQDVVERFWRLARRRESEAWQPPTGFDADPDRPADWRCS